MDLLEEDLDHVHLKTIKIIIPEELLLDHIILPSLNLSTASWIAEAKHCDVSESLAHILKVLAKI